MKKVLVVLFAVFLFLIPKTVHAQETEQIKSYDTNIDIRADGSIGVTEKIDYFFSDPRHGIFRNIPVIKTNSSGKQFRLTVANISVTDEAGNPYTFSNYKSGNNEVVKIGDADRTISGEHWYDISYTVSGALTYFPGHDELYWNWVGTDWPVPINTTQTTITFPQNVARADLNVACFVGVQGATNQDCETSYTDNSITLKVNKPLDANEGATLVAAFPKGIVAVLEPAEVVPFFSTTAGKITIAFILLVTFIWYILVPVLIIRAWLKFGRDPKPAMGEVSAWFSPPKTAKLRDLTPAETGTLIDESADLRDIYATLVDLARRGYMKIIETKKKSILGNTGFDFQKQKDWKKDTDMQPFEKELLDAVFEDDDRVSLKDLDLHDTFETVKKQLYASLVTEGFFDKNPESTRTLYYILAGLAFCTGNIFLLIVSLTFGRGMPRKTLAGAQAAVMAKSLKNFLVSQDKQLKFQAEKQMMFEKLLPYAIAFGVEEVWAKRFATLGLKQPDWYVSSNNGAFNAVIFAHSLGSSAEMSFAASIASHSSSGFSSGFSGGFSGGGGGGGGGGSW